MNTKWVGGGGEGRHTSEFRCCRWSLDCPSYYLGHVPPKCAKTGPNEPVHGVQSNLMPNHLLVERFQPWGTQRWVYHGPLSTVLSCFVLLKPHFRLIVSQKYDLALSHGTWLNLQFQGHSPQLQTPAFLWFPRLGLGLGLVRVPHKRCMCRPTDHRTLPWSVEKE